MIQHLKKKIAWLIFIFTQFLVVGILVLVNYSHYNSTLQDVRQHYKTLLPEIELDEIFQAEDVEASLNISEYAAVLVPKQPDTQPEISRFTSHFSNLDDETIKAYAKKIAHTKWFERETEIHSIAFVVQRIPKEGKLILFYSKKEVLRQCTPFILGSFLCALFLALLSAFVSKQIADSLVKPAIQTLNAEKTFISNASHELKTPLSIIMANNDLAIRKYGEDKYLAYIKDEALRMNSLIAQMLTLERLDSAEQFYDIKNFSVSEAFSEVLCRFEVPAFEKGLTLQSSIPESLTFTGSEFQLKQLLSILLDNAVSYTLPSGSIDVSVFKKGHLLFLNVANTGKELPKEALKNIFERFYRSEEMPDSNGHFGLGLSIANEIVKKHKGNISVQCEDGNIIFCVQLPTLNPHTKGK